MTRRLALTALFLLSCAPALPARAADSEAETGFQEANRLYEKGEFDEALQRYAALASRGFGGVSLFYNLGNVHFRRGQRGEAVLWYERAARLAPRDSDVLFNLGLARSHIRTDGESLARRVIGYFSVDEMSVAATASSFLFFGFLGVILLGRLRGDVLPAMALSVSGALLVGTGAWLAALVYYERQPVAIVVSPPGEVRNGPGDDYAVGFTIPDGSKVLVLNRRPEWTQVGLPEQGLKGWMPTSELELIRPKSAFR